MHLNGWAGTAGDHHPREDQEPDEVRLQQDSAAALEKLECSWGLAKAVSQPGQSGGLLRLGGRSLVQKQWQIVHCTQLKQLCAFGLGGACKERRSLNAPDKDMPCLRGSS